MYGGVRSATVVTDTPCALFTLCCNCTMSRELVLSCVQQSSVMSHFLLLVVRVMEMSFDAAGERLTGSSVLCRAESRQCGAGGGSSDSASCRAADVPVVMLDRCMYSHKSSTLTGSVARASRDAMPSLA